VVQNKPFQFGISTSKNFSHSFRLHHVSSPLAATTSDNDNRRNVTKYVKTSSIIQKQKLTKPKPDSGRV